MRLYLLTFAAAAIAPAAASAADVVIGDFIYEETKFWGYDRTEMVISGVREGFEPTGELVIPEKVTYNGEEFDVVGLGWSSYSGHTYDKPVIGNFEGITSVSLPATLRFIGQYEFLGCPNIARYTVAPGSTHFRNSGNLLYEAKVQDEDRWSLFRYPSAAESPTFAVPADVENIDIGAFAANTHLKKIYISGEHTLSTCWQLGNKSIESVDCSAARYYHEGDNGTIWWGKNLEAICPGVALDTYTLPADTRSISSGAFCNASVKNIIIPEGIQYYTSTSTYMNSDVETVTAPTAPKNIGASCFQWCSSLKHIDLGMDAGSTLDISYCAFAGCTSLESITLPDGLKTIVIGHSAFEDCASLTSFPMTSKMKIPFLHRRAFAGCSSLESFLFGTIQEFDSGGYQFAGSGLRQMHWPSAITRIPQGCFMDCRNLEKINLKESTEDIGIDAFRNSGLPAVALNGVEWYYYSSFLGCDRLSRLYFPVNTRQLTSYTEVDLIADNPMIVVNNPAIRRLDAQDDIEGNRVSLYMSMLSPGMRLGKGWKQVCAPGRAGEIYAPLTSNPVYEMYTYNTFPAEKAVEVTSLMPDVKITGVNIEGVDAVYRGGRWTAPDAVVTDGRYNVTVSYKVANCPMTTTYEYPYQYTSADTPTAATLTITLRPDSRAEFSAEADWTLFNTAGIPLLCGRGTHASLSSLPSGLYIIRATTPGSTATLRLSL